MQQWVVWLATAKTEEEDGNEFPGQVADRGVAGHAALSQALLVGGKWGGLLSRHDELHGPEPNLAAAKAIAAVAELVFGQAGARLPSLEIPARFDTLNRTHLGRF